MAADFLEGLKTVRALGLEIPATLLALTGGAREARGINLEEPA